MFIALRMIWIPMCSVLVLLCLSRSTTYWLLSVNKMSDLVTLVDENKVFLNLAPVYLISLRSKKLDHATLNALLMFSLSILTGLLVVIFSTISLVISKQVAFYFRNSLFSPLIMSQYGVCQKTWSWGGNWRGKTWVWRDSLTLFQAWPSLAWGSYYRKFDILPTPLICFIAGQVGRCYSI